MKNSHGAERMAHGARHTVFYALTLCSLLFALCVTGCGYTLQGKANLPFSSVSIGKIANKTYEPKLEDRMQLALVEALIEQGFALDRSSGYRIDGILNHFELRILSEKDGVAVQYEVIVRGDFVLTDPSGKTRALRKEAPFIASFLSTERLEGVMASKEKAVEKALDDLSREIVASILYD